MAVLSRARHPSGDGTLDAVALVVAGVFEADIGCQPPRRHLEVWREEEEGAGDGGREREGEGTMGCDGGGGGGGGDSAASCCVVAEAGPLDEARAG